MVGKLFSERRLTVLIFTVVLLTVGIVVLTRRPTTVTNNVPQTNNPARQTYAELYDAAWRQDQGIGNTTVTATLVTQPMVSALTADTQRSERDEQILFFTKNLPPTQVAFIVTIDSIAGYFTESELLEKAVVTDQQTDSSRMWLVQAWKPIIGPKPIINATTTVASQAGVMIATLSEPIDWKTLKNLRLNFRNLGDQPVRQFVWAEPGLLAAE